MQSLHEISCAGGVKDATKSTHTKSAASMLQSAAHGLVTVLIKRSNVQDVHK